MLKLNPYHAVIAKAEAEQRTAGAKRKAAGQITAAKKAKFATAKSAVRKAQKAAIGAGFVTDFVRR
jgi:hypothetical protein